MKNLSFGLISSHLDNQNEGALQQAPFFQKIEKIEELHRVEIMSAKNKEIINSILKTKKNVLLVMADEFRFPIDKDAQGMSKDLKNILGFQNVNKEASDEAISKKMKKKFPGFMKLRENAIVLSNHTVATTACVPSRSAMFTGQYGTKNKVTQTDGVFKGASEKGFHWLDPEGIPTIGDWFKEYGYSTHYFGKCHFAHPKKQSLKRWGFDDWETSFPEPHGTLKNNLGMYRDHGFTDLVTTFIRRKAMALDYDQEVGQIEMNEALSKEDREEAIKDIETKPWFAVASFTNPHDITTWPVLPAQAEGKMNACGDQEKPMIQPLPIPKPGTMSTPPKGGGTWTFDMNPHGIGYTKRGEEDFENLAIRPISWKEKLKDKPDCQLDYSLKLGIALASKTEASTIDKKIGITSNSHILTGVPLVLAPDQKAWTDAYLQYYAYLHNILDEQIDRIMKTLEATGQRENTIVVFVPDHGEYGGSHGMMMQKWHSAYQEAIHVPVVVSLPASEMKNKDGEPKQIKELTSHIDIAPTLLGLVGATTDDIETLRKQLGSEVPKFVGADLSKLIRSEEKKIQNCLGTNQKGYRDSILFTTSDMITEPVSYDPNHTIPPKDEMTDYDVYLKGVENYKSYTVKRPDFSADQLGRLKRLRSGSIIQPAEVHCVREGDLKLVRYRDYHNPSDQRKFQWEFYDLNEDPSEMNNLLKYNTDITQEPRFVAKIGNNKSLKWKDAKKIEAKAEELYIKMLELIEVML